MRFNSNLGAAALGVLIVSVALPGLAAGKHFAKAERRANVAINGAVVTGPASAACGRAEPVRQCLSKAQI
jgi:hypothetical protein